MKGYPAALILAATSVLFPVSAQAQPPKPTIVTHGQAKQKHFLTPHGSWEKGPGNYTFTICSANCTVTAPSGTQLALAMELWGPGGAGGWGAETRGGAGGGGGGGYLDDSRTVIVPADGSTLSWTITVGASGSCCGNAGSDTHITDSNGETFVAFAGKPGSDGSNDPSPGGIGGHNSEHRGWPGQNGGSGAHPDTCNGGGGGGGGGGSGPGAINNGGTGGHGGYRRQAFGPLSCLNGQSGDGRTAGDAGGNGKVKITW